MFVLCTAFIYVFYLGYGIIQEDLYSSRFGSTGEKFDHSLFLVLVQCVGNAAVAFSVMVVQTQPRNGVPQLDYLKIAFSYLSAMFASNAALKYVSYPTQALGKSCKLIPVMLMRIFIVRKQYSWREYLNVALTTAGIIIFMSTQEASAKKGGESSWFGLALLFISLALDGYTGPRQEKLLETYKPTIYQMMLSMNLWSILMLVIALVGTASLRPAIEFCVAYPEILPKMGLFALCSALGQIAILVMVFGFDSLVLTTVTTTRKFFTILFSVLWFGHVLKVSQWAGVGLVFLGLFLNTYEKYQKAHAS